MIIAITCNEAMYEGKPLKPAEGLFRLVLLLAPAGCIVYCKGDREAEGL